MSEQIEMLQLEVKSLKSYLGFVYFFIISGCGIFVLILIIALIVMALYGVFDGDGVDVIYSARRVNQGDIDDVWFIYCNKWNNIVFGYVKKNYLRYFF